MDDVRGRKTLVSKEHGCKKCSSGAGSHTRRKTGQTDQGASQESLATSAPRRGAQGQPFSCPVLALVHFLGRVQKEKMVDVAISCVVPALRGLHQVPHPPGCCRFAAPSLPATRTSLRSSSKRDLGCHGQHLLLSPASPGSSWLSSAASLTKAGGCTTHHEGPRSLEGKSE